ncbi:MAG: ATP-binding cassette domain-containing protein [Nocardiopsaceae bacterium]|nr:ATP-binding cassette domain-containing protein [Nocardiopsaceae bacterium]
MRKSFTVKTATVEAVRGIDLTVADGEIFGLLGPNGAGKTTTLRILTTLLEADDGLALVAGADVRRDPALVRRRIGYVGQRGGADGAATGRENLLLAGRLYGLSAAATRARCAELLDVLDLASIAGRAVLTYSGGQRRRLEVALGIMHRPSVLFLDEPTTGLDPQNRANLWRQLRGLRASGTTIVITTHYLDEADQLCDQVAIVDHGRVIAEGTPAGLKRRSAGGTITVAIDPGDLTGDPDPVPANAAPGRADRPDLVRELGRLPHVTAARGAGDGTVTLEASDPTRAMAAVFECLGSRGVTVRAASLAQPSLDDVFLRETGRSLRDADPGGPGPDGTGPNVTGPGGADSSGTGRAAA